MTPLSPTELVFAGFRFARKRPTSILIWSAYYLVVLAVAAWALIDLTGDRMQQLFAMLQTPTPDLQAASALMQDILPGVGFSDLLMLVFGSVMCAAMIRSQTEPATKTWAGLRFGEEELRVLGAYALTVVMLFFGLMAAAAAAGLAAGVNQAAALIVMILGLLLVAALAVRISLAPVIVFTEKRISLRRSWAMTQGVFWRLAGAYVLLAAIAGVVLTLSAVIFGALIGGAALAAGGGVASLAQAARQNFEGMNPVLIGLSVLSNLVQVWLMVVFISVGLNIAIQAYRAVLPVSPKG
jgi:hypothetical protein